MVRSAPRGIVGFGSPGRGALVLHPSRVVRFLGNPWPDPSVAPTPWSDPVLQALYDAVHAVALTMAGATSLMHEAKVDVVTVPNLSEHLSSAETTAQLSARFGYAAAMKSINNLLLLGDGETWNRQRIDFAGLPEMVRTFLQVAAGAADIPVTRLLGQSPAGLSATGESDTRNYYDMISARQELELRPALERLDRVIAASEAIDPGALTFAFRPLWQLDTATAATIALQKAQATQVYAGLKLWPAAVTARLVEAQLAEDGTYPNARAVFGEGGATIGDALGVTDIQVAPLGSSSGGGRHDGEEQPRDWHGRYASWGDETDAIDPSRVGEGPHAPDGTPIEPASAKSRARLLAKGIGALLGLAGRLIRRWRPEEPEETEPLELGKTDPGKSNPAGEATSSPPSTPVESMPSISAKAPTLPSASTSSQPLTMNDLARVMRGFAGRKSAQKWLNQMNKRGWTPEQIEEAVSGGESFPAENRINPEHGAEGYIHPRTGRYVVVDTSTGEVIQVGGEGFDR